MRALVVFLFLFLLHFRNQIRVIQNYLNSNTAKFGLSKKDVLDWTIKVKQLHLQLT
jgi:hypothetical protein